MDVLAGTLVFDGDCGFCTRSLGWLRLLDAHARIATVPFQRPDAAALVDATPQQCRAEVRWKGADGATAGGSAAVAAALSVALQRGWPRALHARTARAQDTVYRWVARHRSRLPGTTPWCIRHPADCGRG
ncbi:DCC1-like thiol-disulfide oxidoreductase family protein [Pseudonocardia benzenivorans]|uniref:DCC1-like thiol-disulfide oxidoreductase family protein n=1 Tax=Pseudonocardia benzenivorans TaxID=228005 RepID=A0ABW3VHP6_9PSEU|nr:hypothetical protein PSD17_66140 [Pseudonocardia sp. D17]